MKRKDIGNEGPSKKRGPGRPSKKKGPGRPSKKSGQGKASNDSGPGSPSIRRGPGRPPKIMRGIPLSKNTVICLLLSHNLVAENEILEYKSGETVHKQGVITRQGISCKCCQVVMSIESFSDHAAASELSSVEETALCVADRNVPLMDCLIQAFEKEIGRDNFFNYATTRDGYDKCCFLCADGGTLVCCETCPSAVHATCLGWKEVPAEDWSCAYCTCKSCGLSTTVHSKLLQCVQCKLSYHSECLETTMEIQSSSSFCGISCMEIHMGLKRFLGKENNIDEGLSWTVLHRMQQTSTEFPPDLFKEVIYNAQVSVAWRIFDASFRECYDTVKKIDILKNVVFSIGSNIPRLNFDGFHLIILRNGEEITSVATLRIHGANVAEIPFMATSEDYRRKGMCRKLYDAIEHELCGPLNIEILILQATGETRDMWINSYGFSEIDSTSNNELSNVPVLMFPNVVKLQKRLIVPNSRAEN